MLGVGAAAFALPSLRGLWASEPALPNTLAPVADATTNLPLLRLREGFSYRSFSWTGDAMAGGGVVPARHDGMAAVPAPGGGVTLLRNHEEIIGAPMGDAGTPVYDKFALPPGTEGAEEGFAGFAGGVTAVSYTPGREPYDWSRCFTGGHRRELRGGTDRLGIVAHLRGDRPACEPDRRAGSRLRL